MVEVPYFLSKYDPDALRFYLASVLPETRDTEFSWEDFVERNNNELVATWGNLGQRPRRALGFMLSFAYKRFDGRVPEPGDLDDKDRALLEKVEACFQTVGDLHHASLQSAFRGASSRIRDVSSTGQCRPAYVRAMHISRRAMAWTILRVRYIIGAEVARAYRSSV